MGNVMTLRRGPRRKLTESEIANATRVRKRQGLVVGKLSNPEYRVFSPAELTQLNIDESYQRMQIKTQVNDLAHVLRQGGEIPDPITVAQRPDKSLWIIDGQQRFWAHMDVQKPLKAMVYKVADVEEEKNIFLAMDRHVKVTPAYFVKAWPGEASKLLTEVNEQEDHPLFGKIDLGGSPHRPIGGLVAVRGMVCVALGTLPHGGAQALLERLDTAWKQDPMVEPRVKRFLDLVSMVCIEGPNEVKLRPILAVALGRVAFNRWKLHHELPLPEHKTVVALRRTNWEGLSPTHALKFLPLVEGKVEQLWR